MCPAHDAATHWRLSGPRPAQPERSFSTETKHKLHERRHGWGPRQLVRRQAGCMLPVQHSNQCERRYLNARRHFPLLHLRCAATPRQISHPENMRDKQMSAKTQAFDEQKRAGQERTKEARICAGVALVMTCSPFLGVFVPDSHTTHTESQYVGGSLVRRVRIQAQWRRQRISNRNKLPLSACVPDGTRALVKIARTLPRYVVREAVA
jgi:hypothetical protein